MCCNILHILSTTVKFARPLLWPRLFKYFVDGNYTLAVPTLAKCLSELAQLHNSKEHQEEPVIDVHLGSKK